MPCRLVVRGIKNVYVQLLEGGERERGKKKRLDAKRNVGESGPNVNYLT